jgi:hypothetical protein
VRHRAAPGWVHCNHERDQCTDQLNAHIRQVRGAAHAPRTSPPPARAPQL